MRRVTASIQMSDNLVGAPVLNCAQHVWSHTATYLALGPQQDAPHGSNGSKNWTGATGGVSAESIQIRHSEEVLSCGGLSAKRIVSSAGE